MGEVCERGAGDLIFLPTPTRGRERTWDVLCTQAEVTRSLGKHAAGRERPHTGHAPVPLRIIASTDSARTYYTRPLAIHKTIQTKLFTGGTGRTKYRVCSAPTHLVSLPVGLVVPNPTEGTAMGMTINLHRVFTSQAGACRLGPSAPTLLRSLLPSRSRPPSRG